MTERPILFSAPMIRALLAGTTTQTRRIVKPAPAWAERFPICDPAVMAAGHSVWWWDGEHDRVGASQDCPYGGPGDLLWVREQFSGLWGLRRLPPRSWPAFTDVWYWADGDPIDGDWTRPKPSIHMPRWASRITLQITDVRVERLQDISEADALAEGIYRVDPDADDLASGCTPDDFVFMAPGTRQGWGLTKEERCREKWSQTAAHAYRLLWDHINGPNSWAANPWVWRVSFEVVQPRDIANHPAEAREG